MQQDARGPVRGEYPALIIDGQQARAQRMQVFAAIVERDQEISAMMFAEQPILDLGRRHGDQRLGVSLPRHAVRRSIQYSGQFAIGRKDGRCDAGQIVVARKKVLAPVHHDRSFEMRRGAKAGVIAIFAKSAFRTAVEELTNERRCRTDVCRGRPKMGTSLFSRRPIDWPIRHS